jgi:hypothetical protein
MMLIALKLMPLKRLPNNVDFMIVLSLVKSLLAFPLRMFQSEAESPADHGNMSNRRKEIKN